MRISHKYKLILISRPRAGSTSIRQVFDKNTLFEINKLKADTPKNNGLHPHIPMSVLNSFCQKNNICIEGYDSITTIRNPIKLLWSYFNFFKPDINCKYNFDKNYSENKPWKDFNSWVLKGRVVLPSNWYRFLPNFIQKDDLSSLSIEARANDRNNKNLITNIFKIEDINLIDEFLTKKFNKKILTHKTNMSNQENKTLRLSKEAIEKIRFMFPSESEIYDI